MKIQRIFTALFLAIALLLINVSTVFAVPPMPSSFVGMVKLDGANVPSGTIISARINGVVYASMTAILSGGDTYYFFDVPGDDPGTPGIIEGGVPGNTVVFYIGGVIADQTAPWVSGTNVTLDLTATTNRAPVASDNAVTTPEDTAKPITLIATDADGNPLTYTVLTGPLHGSLSGSAPNLTYTPASNYYGSDLFTFKANDGRVDSNTATVSISISSVNDLPTISDITDKSTNEDTATGNIPFTIGDVETPVASLTFAATSSNTALVPNGNITQGGSGASRTINILPASNQSGTTTITVTISDGTATASDTFILTVNPVNDLPTISDITDKSTNEDTATGNIPFTIGDVETPVASLTFSATSSNTALVPNGNITQGGSGANRTINILPASNQSGTTTITVTVNDGTATASDTFILTVNPANDPPVITGQNPLSTPEDTAMTVVFANLTVTDPDNSYPTGFTLTVLSGANYTFIGNTITPASNFNGSLTVPVKVNDGSADSNVFNLSVTVGPVNDAPVITGQNPLTTPENTALTIVFANLTVTDPDNSYPTGFTLTVQSGANYTFSGNTITPASGFNGVLTVPVRVNDGTANSNVFNLSITVSAVNVAPVLGAIGNKSVNEGVLLSLSATATDGDNDPLTYSLDSGNPNGSSITSGGAFTWTPSEAQGPGSYPITVRVSDGVLTDFETITVTVNEVNQNPSVTNPGAQNNAEGAVISLQIVASDADLPANTLTYAAANLPTGLSINTTSGLISGTIDFTASSLSPYPTNVTVSDGKGGNTPVNFTWTVTDTVPPPSGLTCSVIQPKPMTASTGEKPQSKVWNYGGNWYAVFPTNASGASSAGTWLWKLQGTTWTEVLKLSDLTDVKADAKVSGSFVHILLYAGANTQLISAEFSGGNYQLWTTRPTPSPLSLTGSEIATIEIDSTGRMWLATENDATDQIVAYYSDSPYSAWSNPFTIASGVNDDDISTVVKLSNQIGIFWSNQNTQRFGFRVHNDANAAGTWSADEVPASQSALNVGLGMGDDHLNLKVASNGTIYAAVKTSYDTAGYPKIALLVRRPAGTWDNLYGVDETGTRGIILLDEAHGYLTYVYTSAEGFNPIVYRQSSTQNINFSSRTTLRNATFNDVSSMKANYNGEFIVMYGSSTEVGGQLCVATPANGADLSITKSDAKLTTRPNETNTYAITATNNGPQAVTGATVADVLPSALTNATWTCSASSGASCAPSGSGNINDSVNLPVGGSVTYALSAKVDLGARGSVVNTATVTPPGGISDPISSNNSATDTDTIIAGGASCEADSTLVGCWQMEENGGPALIDGSSFMNDAGLYNAPAWVAGKVGSYGLDLNGTSQYAAVPDNASLDLTNNITLSAWIRPEQYATQDIIKKATNAATNGYELSLATTKTDSTSRKVFFRINQVTSGDTLRINSTTEYPINGTWMHVLATYDGATMRLYINGVLESSLATTTPIATNSLPLTIGAQDGTTASRWFMGWMDEARVYNRALPLSEIQALAGIAPLTVSKTGTGTGTVTSAPAGIDCGATCTYNFPRNLSIVLTATPALGSTFTSWSGASCAGTGTCTVTMDAAKSVTANFDLAEYAITIVSDHGTVSKSPSQATYHLNDVVTLTATPAAGWNFINWSGGASGTANPVNVTITGNMIVTANYAQNEYTLTINKVGNGTVTKSPNQATYHNGDVVALTATPDAGWSFGGWSANVVSGNVTINGNTIVTATFTQNQYTLTIVFVNGTVAKNPDKATYAHGETVQLTATSNAGYSFVNWTGDATGSTNPVTVTMNGNKSVTANFAQNQYTLTIVFVNGTVAKNPDKATYAHGETVQLTATPNAGYSFVNWTGDATGSTNPVTVTMNGNKSVTATFAQNVYTLTVNVVGSGSVTRSNNGPYHQGDVVTLTPVPAAGWSFGGWSANVVSGNVTINGNTIVTATFTQNEYMLTVNVVGSGSVTRSNNGPYHQGDVVILTPVPAAGWSFSSWSGACTGSGACSVTMDANKTVTATFTQSADTTPPTVLSSITTDPNPSSAASVNFTVTFSEIVTGVNLAAPFSDFSLTLTGVTGAAVSGVSGSNSIYTVTVNTGSGNGTIRLNVVDDDSIKDAFNNPLGGTGAANGNFTSGEVYTTTKLADVSAYVGGSLKRSYLLAPGTSAQDSYASANNGPVRVFNTNTFPIIDSLRVLYGGVSYSEMMGFPANKLTNDYWFPYYNNVAMNSQLRVSNVGGASTTITVTYGNNIPLDSYTLAAGAAIRKNYAGINSGPLHVTSSSSNILTTIRVLYGGLSFSELMGFPNNQLGKDYWYPYYNNVAMNSQLRVSNVGGSSTTITVTYGNNIPLDSYTLAAGTATRKNYPGINSGPLHITSSASNILTTIRVLYANQSFSEISGFPANQLTKEYVYPVYDNVTANSQLRVSNVGALDTQITVYGANNAVIDSYTLAVGAATRKNYSMNSGPLRVVSSVSNILSTQRLLYLTPSFASFYELTGFPVNQLTTEYYFPWYNNVAMNSQLRIAVP